VRDSDGVRTPCLAGLCAKVISTRAGSATAGIASLTPQHTGANWKPTAKFSEAKFKYIFPTSWRHRNDRAMDMNRPARDIDGYLLFSLNINFYNT
jgi:hypothetical protein